MHIRAKNLSLIDPALIIILSLYTALDLAWATSTISLKKLHLSVVTSSQCTCRIMVRARTVFVYCRTTVCTNIILNPSIIQHPFYLKTFFIFWNSVDTSSPCNLCNLLQHIYAAERNKATALQLNVPSPLTKATALHLNVPSPLISL